MLGSSGISSFFLCHASEVLKTPRIRHLFSICATDTLPQSLTRLQGVTGKGECNRRLTSVANAPSGRDREERADGHTHPHHHEDTPAPHPRHPTRIRQPHTLVTTRIRQPLTPSPHEPTTSASLGGSPPYLKANSRNFCYGSFFRGKYYLYG